MSTPALVGWLWGGGLTADAGWPVGVAVGIGGWALALASFAWNDRADVVLGKAVHHRSRRVRSLGQQPDAAGWLLVMGSLAAILGLGLWVWLGPGTACAAVGVVATGWLYSDPRFFGKGRPGVAGGLHLVGGGANAFAGAWAAGAGLDAIGWGVALGALFWAAHGVHQVSDRREDRRAGIRTVTYGLTHREAASAATRGLVIVVMGLVLLGIVMGGWRGGGLALSGVWCLAWLAPMIPRVQGDVEAWKPFPTRCRRVVAVGMVLAVVVATYGELRELG